MIIKLPIYIQIFISVCEMGSQIRDVAIFFRFYGRSFTSTPFQKAIWSLIIRAFSKGSG